MGDWIYLRDGTYVPTATVNVEGDGDAAVAEKITISGYPGETAVIDTSVTGDGALTNNPGGHGPIHHVGGTAAHGPASGAQQQLDDGAIGHARESESVSASLASGVEVAIRTACGGCVQEPAPPTHMCMTMMLRITAWASRMPMMSPPGVPRLMALMVVSNSPSM